MAGGEFARGEMVHTERLLFQGYLTAYLHLISSRHLDSGSLCLPEKQKNEQALDFLVRFVGNWPVRDFRSSLSVVIPVYKDVVGFRHTVMTYWVSGRSL